MTKKAKLLAYIHMNRALAFTTISSSRHSLPKDDECNLPRHSARKWGCFLSPFGHAIRYSGDEQELA
jgi:hypothetical protein